MNFILNTYRMLSLKHTIYNLITCLRSLKLTYTNTLQKQQLYPTNKQQQTEQFNLIHLILNSKRILQIDTRIACILINYAFPLNKPAEDHLTFSKYFQSYLYTYKQKKHLYLKVYMHKETKIEYPISVISLNAVYIIYKLIRSKHPIYIYNQIYKNL